MMGTLRGTLAYINHEDVNWNPCPQMQLVTEWATKMPTSSLTFLSSLYYAKME
jgi:hypothetical protein